MSDQRHGMKILLSGNLGYVGPIVTRHLRSVHPDAKLVGFDSAYFALLTTGTAMLPERILTSSTSAMYAKSLKSC